jgi:uncharacterized protein (TIGR00730 family)
MYDNTRLITIFGTSNASPGDEIFQLAERIGRTLAENGFTIANGGYGGTMLAAAKGAAQANGKTIGVTCSAFGRGNANKYITDQIRTDSLQQRLAKLLDLADAYLVLPGGTGTLLELAQVWELKNKHLAHTKKPVIMVTGFWNGLVEMMARIDPDSRNLIEFAEGPEEIVKILKKYFSIPDTKS